MLGRTTAILNNTIQFKADGSNHRSHERPQVLHQLGVNVRWSPVVVDEQPGADADEVVLVPNATHALNTVMRNFEWRKGDVIIGG